MEPTYRYRALAKRIIDGDTLIAEVDLGFYASYALKIRLHGCDAPEHNAPGGTEATAYLETLVYGGVPLIVESFKDRRSFERWVCDVYVRVGTDWVSVSKLMIDSGHAVPFMATEGM